MCGLFLRKLFLVLLVFSGFVQVVSDIHNSCDSSINKTLEIKKLESRDDLDGFQSLDLLKYLARGSNFEFEIQQVLITTLTEQQYHPIFSQEIKFTYSGRAPPVVA